MAGNGKIKQYAVDVLGELRADVVDYSNQTLPAIDLAEILSIVPQITLEPHHTDAIYDDEELIFQIDPEELEVGDLVVIARDPSQQPIVMGIVNALNPDPFQDPDAVALATSFETLAAEAQYWKAPVNTVADLPNSGNQEGDVRLVIDTSELYKWDAPNVAWALISGGGGGSFLPTTGGTMTGDIVMDTGTVVNITDAPSIDTDAANKKYVDDEIAAVSAGGTYNVTTVNANYTTLFSDRVVLVDASGGAIQIDLLASHATGRVFDIKDRYGDANINNITIVSSDGDTVDGSAAFILTTPYQAVTFVSDGSNWSII